jgi:hypothetical protein
LLLKHSVHSVLPIICSSDAGPRRWTLFLELSSLALGGSSDADLARLMRSHICYTKAWEFYLCYHKIVSNSYNAMESYVAQFIDRLIPANETQSVLRQHLSRVLGLYFSHLSLDPLVSPSVALADANDAVILTQEMNNCHAATTEVLNRVAVFLRNESCATMLQQCSIYDLLECVRPVCSTNICVPPQQVARLLALLRIILNHCQIQTLESCALLVDVFHALLSQSVLCTTWVMERMQSDRLWERLGKILVGLGENGETLLMCAITVFCTHAAVGSKCASIDIDMEEYCRSLYRTEINSSCSSAGIANTVRDREWMSGVLRNFNHQVCAVCDSTDTASSMLESFLSYTVDRMLGLVTNNTAAASAGVSVQTNQMLRVAQAMAELLLSGHSSAMLGLWTLVSIW